MDAFIFGRFGIVAALCYASFAVQAEDCNDILKQGVRNTYVDFRSDSGQSSFEASYCAKSNHKNDRSSGTQIGGQYELYSLNFGQQSGDTTNNRDENCGNNGGQMSDDHLISAAKSVADPNIVAAWKACQERGVAITGTVDDNGSFQIRVWYHPTSNKPSAVALSSPDIQGASCTAIIKEGTVLTDGGIGANCQRHGQDTVSIIVNTDAGSGSFFIPHPMQLHKMSGAGQQESQPAQPTYDFSHDSIPALQQYCQSHAGQHAPPGLLTPPQQISCGNCVCPADDNL